MVSRPARARAPAESVVQDFPPPLEGGPPRGLCNEGCAADQQLAQAAERLAEAIGRGAAALEGLAEAVAPAANGIHNLAEAQRKLCDFILRHRLKLAASVPVVLVAVGAVSPNAAEIMKHLLRVWGVPA